MLVVKVKDNESIDRALKRFKKKFEQTGVLKRVRKKAFYEKPSISRRHKEEKRLYKQRNITKDRSA
jgi:small subunit ribosomal protein S21